MKTLSERLLPPLVMLLPVSVLILGAFALWYVVAGPATAVSHPSNAAASMRSKTDILATDLVAQMEYRRGRFSHRINTELKSGVDRAYTAVEAMYERYEARLDPVLLKSVVKDSLAQLLRETEGAGVWIVDLKGQPVLLPQDSEQNGDLLDAQSNRFRSIVHKAVDTAETKGEGWFRSSFALAKEDQLVYVRKFEPFGWVLGSGISVETADSDLQSDLLAAVQESAWPAEAFLGVYDANGTLLVQRKAAGQGVLPEHIESRVISRNGWRQQGSVSIAEKQVDAIGWHLVYGFDAGGLAPGSGAGVLAKLLHPDERTLTVGAVFLLIVLLMTLSLGYWIRVVFDRYRDQVKIRDNALSEFNASLEANVDEEVQKFRQHEKGLLQQTKMGAMDDIISLIAQQWRQPMIEMARMLGGLEALFEQGSVSRQTFRAKIAEVDSRLRHMANTIEDFRNYFRPDRGREIVDLHQSIEQALALLKHTLASHNITVRTELTCTSRLPLYPNEVIQVLINLLQNAKEALQARGIEHPRIGVECYETGQYVVIRICDNAGGIEAEAAERIFEPYFSTKEQRSGMGLGLFMSRSIVEEHFNGQLTYENLEEGACFYVKIGKHQDEDA